MAQSLALNQQGAIPNPLSGGLAGLMKSSGKVTGVLAPKPAYTPSTGGPKLASNPFSNPNPGGIIGAINKATGAPQSTPNMSVVPKAGNNPGMLPTPTTPLKKTTTTNVDGSSTSSEYHAPLTSTEQKEVNTVKSAATGQNLQNNSQPIAPVQPKIDNQGNPINANGSTSNTTYTPPNQGTTGINQGGLIGNLVANSQQPGKAYIDAQNEANRIAEERTNLAQDFAHKDANIKQTAGFLTQATGLEGILQGQYNQGNAALSAQEQSATNRLSAANTQQGLQQGALTSAIGANAPVTQFGMLTSPTTGQIVGGSGATASGVMQSALQNAIKLIQSGQTTYQDAYNTSGLAAFGVLGQTALQNALNSGGSTFSPTTNDTQVGTNQANLADTQKQAFSVNQNLQQVEKIEPVLTSFLKTSGVNPFDAQIYNGPVMDYLSQIGNSGAAAQWGAQMGELKNFTSQLIASGYGGTPTGAEAATLSQDPSKLSYPALQAYLQTLKDLGGNRLSTLQENIKSLGGTGVAYTGAPASTVTSTTPATPGSSGVGTGITSPTAQAASGAGLEIGKDVVNTATNGANVLSFILGKVF